MPSSVAELDVTDIVLLLVAIRFMPSTVVVEDMVPRLLKEVSLIFQLFEEVAVLDELEVVVLLEELEDEELEELELEVDGHDASSKYHIWFAVALFVHCITFAPDAVLKLSTSRHIAWFVGSVVIA